MSAANIFISHSHRQSETALAIQEALRQRGMNAYAYEDDLPFGDQIAREVRAGIESADCLLVVLSDDSRDSDWVAREVGLAQTLRAERDFDRPVIIGVVCDSPCSSFLIRTRDFERGTPLDSFDFGQQRCFRVCGPDGLDEIDALVGQLSVQVHFVEDVEKDRALLESSFACYERLFEDDEREEPADIEAWIEEARLKPKDVNPWCELWGVMHFGGHAIGVAYVTQHVTSHWAFGNYFGVLRSWRQERRAELLMGAVEEELLRLDPETRGVVFEVRPFDVDRLARYGSTGRLPDSTEREEVLADLRSFRRFNLYQKHGSVAVLGGDGALFGYRQPALDDDPSERDEVDMSLMLRTVGGADASTLSLEDVLAFVYDDVYADAYAKNTDTPIAGYGTYLEGLKQRMAGKVARGWSIGRVSFPRSVRALLRKSRRDGEQLDL